MTLTVYSHKIYFTLLLINEDYSTLVQHQNNLPTLFMNKRKAYSDS